MELTPVELRNGMRYKRDDLHRGGGGTNGAKLRACEHLIDLALANGATVIVTAASVLSPQHAIVANVCRARGVPSIHVVGATNDKSMRKHPSVASALAAGATFVHTPVAYNGALQAAARRITEDTPGAQLLHYGITTHPYAGTLDVLNFAMVGGRQVRNLPDDVDTLVIPFGSGNSATGILTGLHLARRPMAVKLIGIGPPRLPWMAERLARLSVPLPDDLELHDLHTSRYARYADKMPETQDGIDFHPTYEGKVVRYLNKIQPPWWTRRDGRTCMWIIGAPVAGEPSTPATRSKRAHA